MTDKNQTIIQVGDTVKNKKGEVATIEDINGVYRIVYRTNGRATHSDNIKKLNEMEKV